MHPLIPSVALATLLATPASAQIYGETTQTLSTCVDVDPRDGRCDDGEGWAVRDRRFLGDQTFGEDIDIPDEWFEVPLASGRTARLEVQEAGRALLVTNAHTGRLLGEVQAEVPFDGVQAAVSWEGDDVLLVFTVDGEGAALTLAPYHPSEDVCAQEGWYGDGVCDADCPLLDPDCESAPPTGGESAPPSGDDWCAREGWYGDGVCDPDCSQPDPDCA